MITIVSIFFKMQSIWRAFQRQHSLTILKTLIISTKTTISSRLIFKMLNIWQRQRLMPVITQGDSEWGSRYVLWRKLPVIRNGRIFRKHLEGIIYQNYQGNIWYTYCWRQLMSMYLIYWRSLQHSKLQWNDEELIYRFTEVYRSLENTIFLDVCEKKSTWWPLNLPSSFFVSKR